jgi:hypothetical protein
MIIIIRLGWQLQGWFFGGSCKRLLACSFLFGVCCAGHCVLCTALLSMDNDQLAGLQVVV